MLLKALPIDEFLVGIVDAVRERSQVILTATPGAGKTTRLPPELLSCVSGKVIVLQPRRMAAVAAASHIAEERAWVLGGSEVGYAVRFESRVSAGTRLIFMTDALALRRLLDDPELAEVDLVVIDEFHERNLNQDLVLGYVRELQELGRNIKLLVMSATLDTARLQRFLPESVVVDVPGVVHPLEVRHSAAALSLRTDHQFVDRVVEAVRVGARETRGDILVFLPGVGEIARVGERLDGIGREVCELHGSLPLSAQQKVLRGGERARVILATNVAEASVTVGGVDYVIDSGLARVMQTNTATGFSQLELQRIALFNARQRSGRAARQRAGVSVRLWTLHEETTQAEEAVPEVQRVDLSQTLLLLAVLGVSDFRTFSWFDDPPPVLLKQAEVLLRYFGALDGDNRITDLGRKLAALPLPPRLGVLLLRAAEMGALRLGSRAVSLLNERDIAVGAPTTQLECDLSLRLEMLDERRSGAAIQAVLDGAAQLERVMGGGSMNPIQASAPAATPAPELRTPLPESKSEFTLLRKLLISTQSDRLCRRRPQTGRALMVGGRGVALTAETQVRESEFFIALNGMDLGAKADTMVSIACGLSKDFVLKELAAEIEVREDIHFDENNGKFYARRSRFFRDLALDEPALSPIDPAKIGDKLQEVLLGKWDWFVTQNDELKTWMERWRFLSAHDAACADYLSQETRAKFVEMAAFGKTSIAAVIAQDLVALLESVLDRQIVNDFHTAVPAVYTAPTGFKHKIDYSEVHTAYVELKLQEMFGTTTSPKILRGKMNLTFRLLGPNYRPVQVTSDIPGFWQGAYVEIRKELRARYPKHSWPEDPLLSPPKRR